MPAKPRILIRNRQPPRDSFNLCAEGKGLFQDRTRGQRPPARRHLPPDAADRLADPKFIKAYTHGRTITTLSATDTGPRRRICALKRFAPEAPSTATARKGSDLEEVS
jgi:hypothetical protein